MTDDSLSRREFLKGATLATMGLWLAGQEILAAEPSADELPPGPAVACAVIGTGARGKELLSVLSRLENARVAAICDTYEPYLKRAQEVAPNAEQVPDYRRILDNREIEAVFVATPSHLHKEIALAALAAGKHVFCEAPIAATISDAREIATAALASHQVFHVGQQQRANPLQHHVLKFVKAGVLGKIAGGRAQYHKKQSWRRVAPTPEREKELNWRIRRETSPGILGEVGIHQIDVLCWHLNALPTSVAAWSTTAFWQDGRDVPDTIQCVFEFPGGVRVVYDATIANSFDGAYNLLYGSDSAIMMRDERAWMFKEADSPLLGWEVYARKEQIGDENGICLLADASKLLAAGKEPAKESKPEAGKDATYYAVANFLAKVRGQDKPGCGAEEAYRAAVVALKANEAALAGTRLTYEKEWFDLK